MKKTICIILAAALLLCGIALAETDYTSMSSDAFAYYDEEYGLALTEEPDISELPYFYTTDIYYADTFMGKALLVGYFCFPYEDVDPESLTDDDYYYVSNAYCVIGMDGDITSDDVVKMAGDATGWEEFTRADGHNAYLLTLNSESYDDESLPQVYLDALDEYTDIAKAYFTNYVNVPRSTVFDTTVPISFTTTDLDGNEVTAEELLAQADYTLFNVWTTWCGYCVGEMPDLQTIDEESEAVQVVLLLDDDLDEKPDAPQEAKEILAEAGVTLTCVIANEEVDALFPVTGYPTSYLCSADVPYLDRISGSMDAEAYAEWIASCIG